mmetsp:Transcript_42520/g.135077  ORF Transcript_42520/g.135077 Transcript_42520/m.135077 type:complete len:205 (-) Transcript_42520:417-1031(-)
MGAGRLAGTPTRSAAPEPASSGLAWVKLWPTAGAEAAATASVAGSVVTAACGAGGGGREALPMLPKVEHRPGAEALRGLGFVGMASALWPAAASGKAAEALLRRRVRLIGWSLGRASAVATGPHLSLPETPSANAVDSPMPATACMLVEPSAAEVRPTLEVIIAAATTTAVVSRMAPLQASLELSLVPSSRLLTPTAMLDPTVV